MLLFCNEFDRQFPWKYVGEGYSVSIFAISDLHLPGGDKKPMDVFGAHWENHFERVQRDWRARVAPGDIVLLPGDISWAMRLSDAQADLAAIGSLPGSKVLLRGNHDFWWQSISRLRASLPAGMYAIQNDALAFNGIVLCGARGWLPPEGANCTDDDKIYARELQRLELSLRDAARKAAQLPSPRLVALLHFPPFTDKSRPTEVTALLTDHGVHDAVYGHLHGPGLAGAFTGEHEGVRYHQVSCDNLAFALYPLDI